jgi:hypothetical protein
MLAAIVQQQLKQAGYACLFKSGTGRLCRAASLLACTLLSAAEDCMIIMLQCSILLLKSLLTAAPTWMIRIYNR